MYLIIGVVFPFILPAIVHFKSAFYLPNNESDDYKKTGTDKKRVENIFLLDIFIYYYRPQIVGEKVKLSKRKLYLFKEKSKISLNKFNFTTLLYNIII